ncbi:cell surface glycoprotein CD200 receptor 1-A isoform X2 [Megalobrama amblycephala]|uniref:cell surface glycoprotein CD200 receptor 1-A isoform X2 n=1 Tax=Megalobrama amblycephala TaxID=75352 RepID=UPI0020142D82|nr:cell surface glycoprotein CD200 receptor 1-A isoform X2 [Megalobrama amblycephala]
MANNQTLMVVVLLSIFMARSHSKVFKERTFVADNNVTLWCADNGTDVKLNELIFIVWNISMQGKKCYLGLSSDLGLNDTCKDGKKLNHTSFSLFIPKISKEDEGFYLCDLSYKGGSKSVNISVSVTHLETQLDSKNGQRIAVCKATYKETKPSLHWEPALNFSFTNTSVTKVDTFFIMENHVHLPEYVTISNITCVASYPSVSGSLQQNSTLDLTTQDIPNTGNFSRELIIAISSGFFFFLLIIVSLAVVCLLCRKPKHISALKMFCCKSKISPPAEDKPAQPADVEEVEPYASYIQRVNSIYNSSAELFNA